MTDYFNETTIGKDVTTTENEATSYLPPIYHDNNITTITTNAGMLDNGGYENQTTPFISTTSPITTSSNNNGAIGILTIVYVLLFMTCFVSPLLYFFCCPLDNENKRRRQDGSTGTPATNSDSANDGGNRSNEQLNDNLSLVQRRLLVQLHHQSRGLASLSSEPDNNDTSALERAAIRKKCLDEKRVQIQLLMAPYRMILKEEHFPSRTFVFPESDYDDDYENLMGVGKDDKTKDTDIVDDDATTATNDSTSTTAEESREEVIQQKQNSCLDSNSLRCKNSLKEKSKRNRPKNERKKKMTDNANTNHRVFGSKKNIFHGFENEEDSDHHDVSGNPYGDEESIMIRVPIAGLTYNSFVAHCAAQQQDDKGNNCNKQRQCTPKDAFTCQNFVANYFDQASNHNNTQHNTTQKGSEEITGMSDGNDKGLSDPTGSCSVACFTSPEFITKTRLVPGLCTICLSSYKVGTDVVWSSNPQCDHVFHHDCIEPWLVKQRDGPLCPCCRRDFILDPFDITNTGHNYIHTFMDQLTLFMDIENANINDSSTAETSSIPNIDQRNDNDDYFQGRAEIHTISNVDDNVITSLPNLEGFSCIERTPTDSTDATTLSFGTDDSLSVRLRQEYTGIRIHNEENIIVNAPRSATNV